jgi:hypothetical protein
VGEVITLYSALGDFCGISLETADVCKLALECDESLSDCSLDELEAAHDALLACQRWQCDCHANERHALDALDHAIRAEHARLEAADETEADAQGPSCCNAAGCSSCLGVP